MFWPLTGCRRKEARDSKPCKTAPGIVKVDGFDLDIREEGVLVE